MAGPVWFKVRRQLGHEPIVAGRVTGATPLFVERYVFQHVERSVPGLEGTALIVQLGGVTSGVGGGGEEKSLTLMSSKWT